jgi:hypothetical protein
VAYAGIEAIHHVLGRVYVHEHDQHGVHEQTNGTAIEPALSGHFNIHAAHVRTSHEQWLVAIDFEIDLGIT